MTLEQLVTIEAIVLKGSFKGAAEYLNKTQPSVSMAIKKLEEEYQIILFNRDEYRPVLTNEGKAFYQKSKSLLKEYRELNTLLKQINSKEELELRISIDAVSPISSVLSFLKKFFNEHPRTRLELKFEVLSGTIERLIEGEVDLAITPKPSFEFNYESQFFTKGKMVSVINSKLLAQNKISDQFLRGYNQILLADSARRLPKISTGILEGGKNLTVTDIYFKKELILQGLGWGGLPYELVKDEIQNKKLTVIKTPHIKERELDIYILRDGNKTMGPVMKELWAKIKSENSLD